ncbi:MAG: hypothetical protein ACKPE1_16645, partial [Dolichospermum sp.]
GFGLDNLAGTFGSTEIAGSSPANPLLPNIPNGNGGFNFSVTFPDPNSIIFIDPDIAIGYTYTITGDLFDAVQAPSNLTDQSFELLLADATCTTFASQGTITGGLLVPFATGVPCFQILGIDIAEALDPTKRFLRSATLTHFINLTYERFLRSATLTHFTALCVTV